MQDCVILCGTVFAVLVVLVVPENVTRLGRLPKSIVRRSIFGTSSVGLVAFLYILAIVLVVTLSFTVKNQDLSVKEHFSELLRHLDNHIARLEC
jgi:hypothetical protein